MRVKGHTREQRTQGGAREYASVSAWSPAKLLARTCGILGSYLPCAHAMPSVPPVALQSLRLVVPQAFVTAHVNCSSKVAIGTSRCMPSGPAKPPSANRKRKRLRRSLPVDCEKRTRISSPVAERLLTISKRSLACMF